MGTRNSVLLGEVQMSTKAYNLSVILALADSLEVSERDLEELLIVRRVKRQARAQEKYRPVFLDRAAERAARGLIVRSLYEIQEQQLDQGRASHCG